MEKAAKAAGSWGCDVFLDVCAWLETWRHVADGFSGQQGETECFSMTQVICRVSRSTHQVPAQLPPTCC